MAAAWNLRRMENLIEWSVFFGTKEREDKFALYDLATGLPSTDYSEHLGDELFHIDRAAWERTCYLGQLNLGVAVNDSLNARLTHVEEDVR